MIRCTRAQSSLTVAAMPAPVSSDPPGALRRVLRNTGLLLGGRGANAAMGLGALAITARALGAPTMGRLVLIQAFAALVSDVVKFQAWQTILQFGAPALEAGRTRTFQQVVRFGLALDAIGALVGLAVALCGALLWSDRLGWGHDHSAAAAVYMLVVPVMASATPLGLMRLFDRFEVLARQTALVSLVRLVGAALAMALHAGLGGFLLVWAAGQVAAFLYLAAHTWRELHERALTPGFTLRGPMVRDLPGAWRFALTTNLSATLDVALTHAATLAIGALAGPSDAAFWRIGRQVADAVAKPARLLTPALYPELARLRAAGDERGMWRLALRIGAIAAGLGAGLLMVSLLLGPLLLSLVLGEAFAPAAGVMNWQVAALAVGILVLPLEPLLISLGRAGSTAAVQLVVSAAFLSALPWLNRHFGLPGAGAGLLAAEACLGLGFLLVLLHRRARSSGSPP